MAEGELSTAAVHRLIEKAGAARVGNGAVETLREIIENIAVQISKDAIELASHAGRRTVRAEDIKLASKRFIQT
ncbi:NFYB/HAP3 family transcription factor subunit [Candidatus Bathyarchaeota archaeon]|nr:NFYB/HAP3 family transcription factor subunit [Candidatus Bathyarchaeota archaeon]MBS7628454.1 NFYB/HAP3 family transcription factor subunit [Candidatus Bathyarchaeota archaeon]